MIMDALLLMDGTVSSAGVLTGVIINTSWANPPTTTTYYSTNVIDVSQLASSESGFGRDIGIGEELELVVMATVAVCGASGSSVLKVSLQAAPSDGSAGIGSYVELASRSYTASGSSPYPVLTAGQEALRVKIPASAGAAAPKYYRVAYTISGAALATGGTGAILATITLDRQALGPLMGYRSGIDTTYI